MQDRGCDTCAHKQAESRDGEGGRMIDCAANDRQMYSPYASECVRWEKRAES